MAKQASEAQKAARELMGEEAETLAELRELREEELYRLENEKFLFYEPNGKCEDFIRSIGEGKYFVVLFSAANGVGKTYAAANTVAHIIWGAESDNPWFNYPLFKEWPFPRYGRIVSDPTNIDKNVIRTLKDVFPAGRYKASKGNKKFDSIWKCDNGFEFDIMTYEQDPKEFEGSTLGWVWCDEPPTQEIFKACISRLRKGGILFITATPLNGSAWMWDVIVSKHNQELNLESV